MSKSIFALRVQCKRNVGVREREREVEYKLSAANILNLHVTYAVGDIPYVAVENDSIKSKIKYENT